MKATIDFASNKGFVSNGLVAMEVDFANHLRLSSLVNLATGREWIPQQPDFEWGTDDHREAMICGREGLWPDLAPPSSEFLLQYSVDLSEKSLVPTENEDANARPTPVELTGASACQVVPERCRAEVNGDKAILDITVAVADHPIEVTVYTELTEGVPLARRWASVTNTGAHPILLHKLLSLMLSVRPSSSDLDLYWIEVFKHEQRLWRQCSVHQELITASVRRKLMSGPYTRYHDGSNGSMAWAALRDPSIDEGAFLGWEWSGDFDAEMGDFREGAGVFGIRAGFSVEGDYWRQLAPGESFASPKAFLGFFEGDVEEAGRVTRTCAEKVYALPWPEGRAPIFIGHCTWSNWQDYENRTMYHLKPDRLDKEIALAADLGVELFILDYDWFPRLGDWWSDPDRLPDGVESISAKVKSAGMKFGLWMGFGQVHEDSQVVREHPEWLVTNKGKAATGGWGMRSLCLGYPPCRDWVLDQVSGAVERFGVEWLKHDFDLIPVSESHHQAPKASDTRIETVQGYYHIMEKLHERFPHLYLDNWTPATGGADFGNFQRHHSTMMADWYSAVTVRSALNGISHLFPNHRTHTYLRMFSQADEKSAYHYRSGSFGNGMYLLNDMLLLDNEARAVARREIDYIKEDRELFEHGEVYSLIPKQPDHYGWEARFVFSERAGRGMAQVFRNHDPDQEKDIVFRGLNPDAMYDVRQLDAGRTEQRSGSELMTTGIGIRLEQPFSSEIIRLSAGL